jgi:AcrR family transcriptional regulator
MTMVTKPRVTRRAGKLDTRDEVRAAARTLFSSLGFEGTTTKAIAEKAGVATGTVFVHARDKADLLHLVMYDLLHEAIDAGFETLPEGAPLLDQILHVFRALFVMYGENEKLAGPFVKHVTGADGPNGQRVAALTFAFLHRIAGVVQRAQERGEIVRDVDAMTLAQNVFALYLFALTTWLGGYATLDTALDPWLKSALALQLRGLRAAV